MRGVPVGVIIAFVLLPSLVLSTGCTVPIAAGAYSPPGQDFSEYASFSWEEPEERPTGEPRLDSNPLFQQRVHAAIEWELSTRGIELADDEQDEFEIGRSGRAFGVHHYTSVEDYFEVYGTGSLGFSADGEDEAQVEQYPRATFIVGLVDVQTRELAWSGWAELNFDSALANPAVMQRQVDAAVAAMFERFPVPVGGVVRDAR